MWPLISSLRISSACWAASSGVSANLTPPAFIRPPLSTWDLTTTGPPISSAALRACSALVQKPYLVTGIPASSTIFLASYSKKRIAARNPTDRPPGILSPVLRLGIAAVIAAFVIPVPGCGGTAMDDAQAAHTNQLYVKTSLHEKVRSVHCPSGQAIDPKSTF